MPYPKKTCRICFDDDLEVHQMLSIALCDHQFCEECMKQYIEAMLLEGEVPRCPHYQCESKPTLISCANLLTPKLREMWEQRIEENLIPVGDRVYCPDPMCSALMSVSELSKSTKDDGYMRCCFKCCKPFCISCKVSWHNNLSCGAYKRLVSNLTTDYMMLKTLANQNMWRQCEKCQHMIERSFGCNHVTCRCGYSFCYACGEEWKQGGCSHRRVHFLLSIIFPLFPFLFLTVIAFIILL